MVTRFVEEMLSGRKVEEEREGRKRRGNAYILERGGGNDPLPSPPPSRAYEKEAGREGEGVRRGRSCEKTRGKIRCLSVAIYTTRRPRWNRMVAVTQLRRVSVYTAVVVGGKHQRHVG